MLKFFKNPFAILGTRAAVPAADPATGEVNYPTGYPAQYQLPKTDPLSRNIERDKMNQIFFDMTNEMQLLQAHGVPDFITTALNEGAPFEYGIGDYVRYTDGGNTRVYVSRVAANVDLPTVTASWRLVRDGIPTAVAGGTANALTANFVPDLLAIQNGDPFLLEHTLANTGAATLAIDGGAALPIVKGAGSALLLGDIAGANSWGEYVYDASLASYVLLNPAYPVGTVTVANDGAFADNSTKAASTGWVRGAMAVIATAAGFVISLTTNGYIKFPSWLGSLILQWGTGTLTTGAVTITFPIAFPTSLLAVTATDVAASLATLATVGAGTGNTTQCDFYGYFHDGSSVNTSFRWFAIGY